ncbi:hypothetical protein H632_c3521p0, partial [Helicosporidium sp. ATCC 50920]
HRRLGRARGRDRAEGSGKEADKEAGPAGDGEARSDEAIEAESHGSASGTQTDADWVETPSVARTSAASRTLYEYARPDWEFHAKGMWWRPPGFADYPVSVLGSSNFGARSAQRDLELQFFLVSRNPGLQGKLGSEVRNLLRHAQEVTPVQISAPERRAGPAVRAAVRLLKSFL